MPTESLSSPAPPFLELKLEALLDILHSSRSGLSTESATEALERYGLNSLAPSARHPRLRLLASQFKSPISILLGSAALLSAVVGESFDGAVILGILMTSSALGYWQELRAQSAVELFLKRLEQRTKTLRDGSWKSIPSTELVPGDVISLAAGSRISADCRVISAKDLSVDQSSLTGESFPRDKDAGDESRSSNPLECSNAIFAGSHVVSGEGIALVVATGRSTVYGSLAAKLRKAPPPTEFELGVRNFGYLILEVAAALSLIVFAINIGFHRPILDVLLFTLALLVGMTPQLLPAIATTTLAQGAHRMAQNNVLVRRLNSIADLGGISILCTDKTGTLTEGSVGLCSSTTFDGQDSEKTALFSYLNALHQSGFSNVIDETLRKLPRTGAELYQKVDEIPYDFTRRLLSVVLESGGKRQLITKGALHEVLDRSSSLELVDGSVVSIEPYKEQIGARFKVLSEQGKRCLGVAYREVSTEQGISREIEDNLTFLGFISFIDPMKASAIESIGKLEESGISCKVVTGDNRFVAAKLARDLGVLSADSILTGTEIDLLSDQALRVKAQEIDIFAEVSPHQKERIIFAFKRLNLGVGYLGDGINDAAALRAGDVGISVDSAADVTKEAADIVLLNKDLRVLHSGVVEGRRAFANTLKYILVTTSANFGNMFSVAGASFFADFLPMLPPQILLLNVLSDFPAMALATDRIDPELCSKPIRWSSRSITLFMLVFGFISSVFDYLTFGTLLILGLPAPAFRTGWFIESVISEICALLVVRTQRSLFRSRPGKWLTVMSFMAAAITVLLPFSELGRAFGFAAPSLPVLIIVGAILFGYTLASELGKSWVLRKGRRTSDISIPL